MRLLLPGGVLVSDNVLQDGDIIESKFAVTRRDCTIHKRMREYLYTLMNHGELVTTILPVGLNRRNRSILRRIFFHKQR